MILIYPEIRRFKEDFSSLISSFFFFLAKSMNKGLLTEIQSKNYSTSILDCYRNWKSKNYENESLNFHWWRSFLISCLPLPIPEIQSRDSSGLCLSLDSCLRLSSCYGDWFLRRGSELVCWAWFPLVWNWSFSEGKASYYRSRIAWSFSFANSLRLSFLSG